MKIITSIQLPNLFENALGEIGFRIWESWMLSVLFRTWLTEIQQSDWLVAVV